MSDLDKKVLPDELTATLLDAMTPIEPAVERAQHMRGKLLERVRGKGQGGDLITVSNVTDDWIETGPGNTVKILRTDDDSMSMLVRLEPGTTFPAHSHPADEETYVVDGETWFGDIHLVAGDYHLAPKGTEHGEVRTDTGCTLFIRKAAE